MKIKAYNTYSLRLDPFKVRKNTHILYCFLLPIALYLFISCSHVTNVEKQHILSAEQYITASPSLAKEELEQIAEITYLKMPLKWQARYTYLQCQIADKLESDFPLSREINEARAWYIKKGEASDIAALCLFLGRVYTDERNYEKAIESYLYGLDWAKKANLINESGYINSYLADLYLQNNHIETALSKYRDAADCFLEANNLRSYGFAKRDIGHSFDLLELHEEAIAAMNEADSIGKILNDSLIQSTVLNGLGNIYLSMGEYDQAIDYFLKSVNPYSTSSHDKMALTEAYIETDRLSDARQILDAMLQDSIPEIFERGIHYYYYQIYSKEGKHKLALDHFEQYYHLINERLDEIEERNYIEVEKKYNHLNQTIQVKDLIIDKQRNILLISLLSVMVVILIFLYLYWRKKAKRELARKQHKITCLLQELKNKEKEFALANGEMVKQKEEEIKRLKDGLLETRENMIKSSSLRKNLINKIKNYRTSGKILLNEETQLQIELEIDIVYPDLLIRLIKQFPNLTKTELQYCVLSLYDFDTNQESVLLNIDPGSVSKRRTRIREKLQTSFVDNNLSSFLKNYSLNM